MKVTVVGAGAVGATCADNIARKEQIGSGDRSERIRTYNYPQSRVTDHRINLNLYKLDAIMLGNMADLVKEMRDHDRKTRLAQAKST